MKEPQGLEGRLPLSYADPALNRADRDRARDTLLPPQGWRRFGLGAGLACVLGGFAYGMWPNTEEAQFWMAAGGFLLGLSLPAVRAARGPGPGV